MTITWVRSALADIDYPAAPWPMVGSMWLTLFRSSTGVDACRPAGIYGATFVSYDEGSPLTYGELLVARPVEGRRVTVTDIWVDSPQSVAGGRELWAIPKGLCAFERSTDAGRIRTTSTWSARTGDGPLASARFTDVSRLAPRAPFKGTVWQPGITDTNDEERTAPMSGSARSLPCRAHWTFDPDGPLGWLARARQLGSVCISDFRMTFG